MTVAQTISSRMASINFKVSLLGLILVVLSITCNLPEIQANRGSKGYLKKQLVSDFNPRSNAGSEPDNYKGCTVDYNIDHVKLVMSWGPGYCSSGRINCKSNIKPEFSLHGLWPQGKDKESPIRCCTRERFDIRALLPINEKLRRYWPSLSRLNEEGFWPYQWDKHGSCASKIQGLNTVYDYFNFAADTMKNSEINSVMPNHFKPSNEKPYYGQAIVSALARVYGFKVSIDCSAAKNKPWLNVVTAISACFNTKLKPIDCPYTKRSCLNEVLLPATVI